MFRHFGLFLLSCSLLLWTTVSADPTFEQQLASVPQCAIQCSTKLLSITSCSLSDAACICNDKPFSDAVEKCVLAQCTVREQLATAQILSKACDTPVRDHRAIVLGVALAFFPISLFVCGVRFAIRWKGTAFLGTDDVLMGAAIVLLIPCTASVVMLVKNGLGLDIFVVDPDKITPMLHWYFTGELLYFCITTLTKMSVLCFYLRIFPDKILRRNSIVTLVILGLSFIAFLFASIFQCSPVDGVWMGWDGEHPRKCIDVKAVPYAQSITNIVLDIPILLIPIPSLRELALPIERKLGLILVFTLGFLTTIVTILRLQCLVNFSLTTPNLTYDLAAVSYWSMIEINVGILCVTLPTIRPFMRTVSRYLCGPPPVHHTYQRQPSPFHPRPVMLNRDLEAHNDSIIETTIDSNADSVSLVEISKPMPTVWRTQSVFLD